MSLVQQKHDWQSLGELDPFWAVLTDADKKFGRWGLEAFFARGQGEIDRAMAIATRLGYPKGRERALDFGCGVGRLTRAMASQFGECYGVDIAESMVQRAREINADMPACTFQSNDKPDLRMFEDGLFDFLFTTQVLMHMPTRDIIKGYIAEFLRVIKPDGIAVFQLLSHAPLLDRVQPRRRVCELLRNAGVPERILYTKLGYAPMNIRFIPEAEVVRFVKSIGGKVLDVEGYSVPAMLPGTQRVSRTYYMTRGLGSYQ
jgi:ubiquinone/menaquinone biosynthesis C-methylase UbiE